MRKLQRMTTIREFSLPPPYGLVTVPVIALNSPQQHILIRGGVSEGLQKGQVVLHPDGHVVGRVEKVGNQWSRVVLVFHPSFHLPAVGKESHLHCIVTGNEENALLLHQEWPQPLQDQELVVTSDYGEVCPPHIPLGRWCAEKKLILPIVNPYTLDYVHVVRRLPPLPNFSKH